MNKIKSALFVVGVFVAFLGMSFFESNMIFSSITTILGLAIANLGKWGNEYDSEWSKGFIQGKLDCMKKCGVFNKEDINKKRFMWLLWLLLFTRQFWRAKESISNCN